MAGDGPRGCNRARGNLLRFCAVLVAALLYCAACPRASNSRLHRRFGGACTQLIVVAGAVLVSACMLECGSACQSALAIARWTFGISSFDFGLAHLTDPRFVAGLIQKWMPLGGEFWAILSGVAFILAGLGILSGVLDVLAARLLALMLLIFDILVLVPLPIINPHDHVAWGANAYNMAAVGASWILAESLARCRRERTKEVSSGMSLMWRNN